LYTERKEMTRSAILQELETLPISDRLAIAEAALRSIRQEMQGQDDALDLPERKRQLATAAEALLQDYETDSELTSFTALDAEDFDG
jgi:hypothetical protein